MAANPLLACGSATSWYDFTYPLSWSNECEVSTLLLQKPGLTTVGCGSALGHSFHICGDPGVRCINIISRDEKNFPVSTVVLRLVS